MLLLLLVVLLVVVLVGQMGQVAEVVVVVEVVEMVEMAEMVVVGRRCDHVWPLVALHVRGERGRRVVASIANGALEWFSMIVGFQVDFEMVAS